MHAPVLRDRVEPAEGRHLAQGGDVLGLLRGVNAGASCAVVISLSLGVAGLAGSVWFAFAGAALASVAVYAIGTAGRGGATPVRLALAGTALTAALTAVSTAWR